MHSSLARRVVTLASQWSGAESRQWSGTRPQHRGRGRPLVTRALTNNDVDHSSYIQDNAAIPAPQLLPMLVKVLEARGQQVRSTAPSAVSLLIRRALSKVHMPCCANGPPRPIPYTCTSAFGVAVSPLALSPSLLSHLIPLYLSAVPRDSPPSPPLSPGAVAGGPPRAAPADRAAEPHRGGEHAHGCAALAHQRGRRRHAHRGGGPARTQPAGQQLLRVHPPRARGGARLPLLPLLHTGSTQQAGAARVGSARVSGGDVPSHTHTRTNLAPPRLHMSSHCTVLATSTSSVSGSLRVARFAAACIASSPASTLLSPPPAPSAPLLRAAPPAPPSTSRCLCRSSCRRHRRRLTG